MQVQGQDVLYCLKSWLSDYRLNATVSGRFRLPPAPGTAVAFCFRYNSYSVTKTTTTTSSSTTTTTTAADAAATTTTFTSVRYIVPPSVTISLLVHICLSMDVPC